LYIDAVSRSLFLFCKSRVRCNILRILLCLSYKDWIQVAGDGGFMVGDLVDWSTQLSLQEFPRLCTAAVLNTSTSRKGYILDAAEAVRHTSGGTATQDDSLQPGVRRAL
jgi:hypothetical protein